MFKIALVATFTLKEFSRHGFWSLFLLLVFPQLQPKSIVGPGCLSDNRRKAVSSVGAGKSRARHASHQRPCGEEQESGGQHTASFLQSSRVSSHVPQQQSACLGSPRVGPHAGQWLVLYLQLPFETGISLRKDDRWPGSSLLSRPLRSR